MSDDIFFIRFLEIAGPRSTVREEGYPRDERDVFCHSRPDTLALHPGMVVAIATDRRRTQGPMQTRWDEGQGTHCAPRGPYSFYSCSQMRIVPSFSHDAPLVKLGSCPPNRWVGDGNQHGPGVQELSPLRWSGSWSLFYDLVHSSPPSQLPWVACFSLSFISYIFLEPSYFYTAHGLSVKHLLFNKQH